MKAGYIAGVLCAIAALTAPVASYPATPGPESAPGIRFDSDVFDFGDITADSIRSHSFVLTNDGTAPLVITKVYSSCGCTTAAHTKEPVMPGDTARIVVSFNPAGRPAGYFTKLVRIRSNAAPRPHRLYIKGKITRAK